MKHEVTLYVAGTVFKEEVHARDYQEAQKVALARNPNATVVSVNDQILITMMVHYMHHGVQLLRVEDLILLSIAK